MNTFYLFISLQLLVVGNFESFKANFFEGFSDRELLDYYDTHSEIDSLKTAAQLYLVRAKEQNKVEKIARGYDLLARLYDYETNQKYADSLIQVSSGLINNRSYPIIGYLLKGYHFYNQDYFIEALMQFEKAQDLVAFDDFDKIITLRIALGAIYRQLGIGSVDYYFKTIEIIEGQANYKTTYYDALFDTYQSIAYSYMDKKEFDSAEVYFGLCQALDEVTSIPEYVEYMRLDKGVLAFKKQEYAKALDHFNQVDEFQLMASPRVSYLLKKGEAHRLLGNYKEAHLNFVKADLLYSKHRILPQDLHLAYNFLIAEASQSDNYGKQQYYTAKFLEVQKEKDTRRDRFMAYVKSKGEYLKAELYAGGNNEVDNTDYKFWTVQIIFVLLLILVAAVFAFINSHGSLGNTFSYFLVDAFFLNVFRKRNMKLNTKNEEPSTQQLEIEENEKTMEVSPQIGIDAEVVEAILEKLLLFETKKSFIKYGKLKEVADHLNTNSTYLSKIVNTHKACSFGNYIHKLRINEAVLQLNSNPVLKTYTIDAISKEFGYNSVESFSRAFKKIIGNKPSEYLKIIL